MPVVTLSVSDLQALAGKAVPAEEMAATLPMIGGDLDSLDGDELIIEWFPDRPDLLTPEGTARAFAAFIGTKPGLPKYEIAKGQDTLTVDPQVAAVRPYAALCYVRGVPFDEELLKRIVDAQEKLCLAPGRKRRKIAIGVHDASNVQGPFTYTIVGGADKPFVPLKETRQMTPQEIIADHPKGQEYGHLLDGTNFPVFLDGNGEVLSMPPIINAAKTTVTATTRDVLLDVTGTDQASVKATMALLATSLADRGGTIEPVTVTDASGTWQCPDLQPTETVLEVESACKLLGLQLSGKEVAEALQKMGHDAEEFDTKVVVQTGAWRSDLLHAVDWIEDIAIGYGYANFPGKLPQRQTFGAALPHQELADKVTSTLCGLGWHEAITLSLTSPELEFGAFGRPEEEHVRVRNPVLLDRTILRTSICPSLFSVLAKNRHRPLPQRLWELGEVVVGDQHQNQLRLGIVEVARKTGFADAKALVEALDRHLGLDLSLRPADVPGLISGRAGEILRDGRIIGTFGELHPETITRLGLGAASIMVELEIAEA